jgi:hypothetical protein
MSPNPPFKFEFKTVQVRVEDKDGKPIPGASVTPTGIRVKGIHAPDAYGWRKEYGPAETVVTDAEGKASVKYPVVSIPEEKEFTGALILSVSQPEFSPVHIQVFHIDGEDNPIRLERGITLEISGYFGPDHQPVTDIVPNFAQDGLRPEDWQKNPNGVMTLHQVAPGGHTIQLMGRLPSGEIVYSETALFTAETRKLTQLALEMKPGIRLEGHIDSQVPRPIRNGRVMISVRPKEFPAMLIIEDFYDLQQKYGQRSFWHSYRPVAEDGSFVFESIPPGEVDVVVLGDGFVSKSVGKLQNRVNGTLQDGPAMAIPQAFPLVAPVTQIEVATEPSAILEVTTRTKSGQPIEGARAYMFPSAFRMRGKFGYTPKSSEAPFREIPPLSDPFVFGATDQNGKLVITNFPAEIYGMNVEHPKYQMQLRPTMQDRYIRTKFSPGTTNVVNFVLEPKGTDFIGTAK